MAGNVSARAVGPMAVVLGAWVMTAAVVIVLLLTGHSAWWSFLLLVPANIEAHEGRP